MRRQTDCADFIGMPVKTGCLIEQMRERERMFAVQVAAVCLVGVAVAAAGGALVGLARAALELRASVARYPDPVCECCGLVLDGRCGGCVLEGAESTLLSVLTD